MSERVWHKGPPPHVGWWNASMQQDEGSWRWWDGKDWSYPLVKSLRPEYLVSIPVVPAFPQEKIEWTDYWPENARVPRLDPTGGHWTFNVDGMEPKHLPRKIDLAMRNSDLFSSVGSSSWYWGLDDSPFDILAWRPAA